MVHREFVTPDQADFLSAFGVEPRRLDAAVFNLRVEGLSRVDDLVELTWDILGRSVRCSWSRAGVQFLDSYKEGATLLAVRAEEGVTYLDIKFETDGMAGSMRLNIIPEVSVEDRLLCV